MSEAEIIIDRIGFGKYQIKIMPSICIASILLIGQAGVVAFLSSPWQRYFYLTDWERSAIPFGTNLAGAFMSLILGYLADQFGRLQVLQFCTAMSLFLSIVCTLAPTANWIILSQWLLGAFRIPPSLLVLYTREFLPSNKRYLIVLISVFQVLSFPFFGLLPFLVNPNIYWREFTFVSLMMPLAVVTFLSFQLPQSPCFLVTKGDNVKARNVLMNMAKENLCHPYWHHSSLNRHTLSDSITKNQDLERNQGLFDIKRDVILIILTGFTAGLTSLPFRNMAIELSKYTGNSCNNAFAHQNTIQCSEVKYLTNQDFLIGLYSTLGPVVTFSSVLSLSKFISFLSILRVSAALFPITIIPMLFCFSKATQQVSLVLACCLSSNIYYLAIVYMSERLPVNIRAFGSAVLITMDRLEAATGYVAVEKLLYVNFKVANILYMLLGVGSFVSSLFLSNVRLRNDE